MFNAYAAIFNVTENFEKFLGFGVNQTRLNSDMILSQMLRHDVLRALLMSGGWLCSLDALQRHQARLRGLALASSLAATAALC